MPKTPFALAAALCCLSSTTALHALSLADFQTCIGPSGVGTTCQLSSGTYTLSTPLVIGRSGITVEGGVWQSPTRTVLRRGASGLYALMEGSTGITSVTVRDLMFDGNRYGFGTRGAGISCITTEQFGKVDLDLSQGGTFTVEWLDFINAPETALHLAGISTAVAFSNFGMGGAGIKPDGTSGTLTDMESATRFTAVYISGYQSGAYYNSVCNAGTAGTTLDGQYQYVYGNYLGRDRYEISDGSGGGQLTLWPGPWGTAAFASVTGNVINGDYWPTSTSTLATGCTLPTSQISSGVEANGTGHRFFNNEIEQNTSDGMSVNLGNSTGQITVSSTNPWYANDAPRYIEANSSNGITFLAPPRFNNHIEGVALHDVLVSGNGGYGVFFQNTADYGTTHVGFMYDYGVKGACIQSNAGLAVGGDTQWYAPSSMYPDNYSSYQGGSNNCPQRWVTQTPAPSNMPGWPW